MHTKSAEQKMLEDNPLHQFEGPPSPVQGNYMNLESQLVANGIYCGDTKGFESPEAKRHGSGAKDWALLLQVDSEVEKPDYCYSPSKNSNRLSFSNDNYLFQPHISLKVKRYQVKLALLAKGKSCTKYHK